MVGLTDHRFIVLPLFGNWKIKIDEIMSYQLDGLAPVVASTGPFFTHIKILDSSKPFIAKFHRYAFGGKNRANAMAIAARLTEKPV